MKTTTPDGVEIDYVAYGKPSDELPSLVLTTAWCMSRNGWTKLPEALAARGFHVISLDFRGHGASEKPAEDFGAAELLVDALAAAEAAGAKRVVPVTMSHSGWVGVDIRQKLGPDKVPAIVHTDWLVLPPPAEYMGLVDMLNSDNWEQARDILFSIWLEGVTDPDLVSFVKDEMGSYDAETWKRSGREIGACIRKGHSALEYLATCDPATPALHVYAQPLDPGYLAAQQGFAEANPWFKVHHLESAVSHFPTFEDPDEMADVIADFVKKNS